MYFLCWGDGFDVFHTHAEVTVTGTQKSLNWDLWVTYG